VWGRQLSEKLEGAIVLIRTGFELLWEQKKDVKSMWAEGMEKLYGAAYDERALPAMGKYGKKR